MKKEAGILLPIFSLPNLDGIGSFGKEAYEMVDYVKACGFSYLQVLPLNALDRSYSPYQSITSFGGETAYIDLHQLVDLHLINHLEPVNFNGSHVEYKKVKDYKEPYFKEAFAHFDSSCPIYGKYIEFKDQTWWLKEYCSFKVLYHLNNKTLWPEWTNFEVSEKEWEYEAFKQFLFYEQWTKLKAYANSLNIQIIGDLPFYVGFNSEDVYNHREIFKLDENNQPSCVSGVPPDYFNPDGQRWNHPIYDWDKLKEENYCYWNEKIVAANQLYDIVRLDHFRAFDTFWQVDVHSIGAKDGKWIEAPGDEFFDQLLKQEKDLNIIVEDLGYLRQEVYDLKDKYQFKGMKILQFSFDEVVNHQVNENCLLYTGTHDNNTLKGWLQNENREGSYWDYLRLALESEASLVIMPLQDLLGYDDMYRINMPGTEGDHNWTVRFTSFDDLKNNMASISKLLEETDRK